MKKLILAVMLMIMGIGTMSAQRLGGPYHVNRLDTYDLYYGFRLGYNTSSLRFSSTDISTDNVSGMNFGFIAGFPLGNSSVIFEPGLLYSVKGGKAKDHNIIKNEVHMHGIEIPLVLKYDVALPTMSDISIQPFFGGFFDFGMGGTTKKDNGIERKKLKTYSDRFQRFDAGIRMGCGVNIEFFYIELAYDLGIANLGQDSKAFNGPEGMFPSYNDWDDEVKSGCFSINFGVNF